MREALSRYIRSLAEQEQAKDAPERRQDLGTFVDWLLERQDFTIHLRTYKHEGTAREKNAGKLQHGVDILASKPDPDGEPRLYRFVLKEGKIESAEWAAGGEQKSMVHDIWRAAGRHRGQDGWYTLEDIRFKRFTVVAVHNGDLDRESLSAHVAQLRDELDERGIGLEWWDAGRLVELSLTPAYGHEIPSVELRADASLFPPGVRPFVRGALDSLGRTGGRGFDLEAVDRLLDEVLPLGRELVGSGPGERLGDGGALAPRVLRRLLSELALFAKMVEVECSRVAKGSTLPVFDTIERILCRAMEHVRRTSRAAFGAHLKAVDELLRGLVLQYVAQAETLIVRLELLRAVPRGLAIGSPSEPVDYPLRALRLGGYLATTGLWLLSDPVTPQPERARRIAEILHDLWTHNEGGFANPVTDDQLIELGLIWELWLRAGMRAEVAETAGGLLERLFLRKALDLPLPALYQRARVPMKDEHAQTLSETYLRGRRAAPPAFEDGGSTLAPLAVYLAHTGGRIHDARLQALAEPGQVESSDNGAGDHQGRSVHLQSWMPPADAATEWFAQSIEYRGHVQVFDVSRGVAGLVADFSEFNQPLPASPADAWSLPVIDRMAWKLWRTPPPMALFIALV
ncbi:hypothetical protein [Sorangium sp. So ce1335]|uniref:hypothetical protein n=1 Tax=Sorangium sp. So ce1335 TaxID=3133335 RepID=UPI003F5EC41E